MNEKNILVVIEELGALINTYKNEIEFQDIQIKNLENKINKIETYIHKLENKGAWTL